ncbi:MAG: hypothetical protein IPL77_01170 [Flavobacteriales bacterium]|nr:hypothetical protein [Flavobacteriales bacterium]MBK9539262.1 hypothetical protein [Flavobacteriales bacterium]
MPRSAALLLIAAFALSVLVRLPQLGRPLSKNHEFCAALVLVVHSVWEEDGFLKHHGCPAVTYPNPGDRGVIGLHYDLTEQDGIYYYVSHLPMAYWAPYAAFKVLGVTAAEVPLRIFNVLLHGLTALLFFGFLKRMLGDLPQHANIAAWAAAFYLLMPGPLWFHGNVYMSDMAVQLPWAWSLFTFARLGPAPRPLAVVHFLLASAVLAATEWIGVFVVFTMLIVLVHRWRRTKDQRWLSLGIAQCVVAAIVVVVCLGLYASRIGWSDLVAYLFHRYEERGVLPGEASATILQGFWQLCLNLLRSWGTLVGLGIAAIVMNGQRSWPAALDLLLLTLLPAVLHLLIFVRYGIHEFAVLKLGFLLCATVAIVLFREATWGRWSRLGAACALLLGMAWYTWVNRPGDGTATGEAYATAQKRGLFIAAEAQPDEVILLQGIQADPQIQFYARRNMRTVADSAEAIRVLNELGARKGLLFRDIGGALTADHLVPADR